MTELGPVPWPPAPIRTERLVLREPEARDRAAFIELLASPEVHTYLGGPRPPGELERELPGAPERWPGSFVVDLDGEMIGQILLRRATGHSSRQIRLAVRAVARSDTGDRIGATRVRPDWRNPGSTAWESKHGARATG